MRKTKQTIRRVSLLAAGVMLLTLLGACGRSADIPANDQSVPAISHQSESAVAEEAGFTGHIENGVFVIEGCTLTDEDIVIPDTIGGVPTGAIADEAFYHTSTCRSITIPDSVTSIGKSAFTDCNMLEEIHLGSGLKTVGDFAFVSCTRLTEVVFPEGTETLGEAMFTHDESLKRVVIPESVKEVPEVLGDPLSCKDLVVERPEP